MGPPFSDTICHAEPLSSILFWVQSLIQSSVFIVSQPCVMSLKKQRPQEEPEDFGFSAIIQSEMTVQQTVSALAGVFVKAPERTKSDKQGDLVSRRGAFQKVTVWSNLFYTGRQASPGHIPRNNSVRLKSIFQMNYCFCLIYMNAWCIFWLSKTLFGLLLESLQLA